MKTFRLWNSLHQQLKSYRNWYVFYFLILLLILIMETAESQMKLQKLMRAAQFEVGGPENLSVGQIPIPELKEKQVLMRVIASTVNRADIGQRRGFYPPPAGSSEILGLDAAGLVHSLGPGCGSGFWTPGDRVMALLPGGGNAEYVAVHQDHLIRIPDKLSFIQAAAIPEAWLTAFQILNFVGDVQANETVLIHAGGSGVGTAAIQLARMMGARPLVTAGSQEKIDAAVRLGAVAGINYKDESFVPKVLELTEGRGVDLILDCIGGSFASQNCQAISRDGRWVIYGTMGGPNASENFLREILMKRIQLTSTTLRTRNDQYKQKLVKAFAEKVVPYFVTGDLILIIDSVYPLGKIGDAHRHMEENKNIGKIIIQLQNEEIPTSVRDEL